jgi:hypothetical protein
MGYLHTDQTTRGRLRLVFDDRVISHRLRADATFEDVAAALRELAPQRYGDPVAIDVTMADFSDRSSLSRVMPSWLKYEDDPAAEFESATSSSASFRDLDQTAQIRA